MDDQKLKRLLLKIETPHLDSSLEDRILKKISKQKPDSPQVQFLGSFLGLQLRLRYRLTILVCFTVALLTLIAVQNHNKNLKEINELSEVSPLGLLSLSTL